MRALLQDRRGTRGRILLFTRTSGFAPPKNNSESFLNMTSGHYLHHLYEKWHNDSNSVPSSWDTYFRNLGDTHERHESTAARRIQTRNIIPKTAAPKVADYKVTESLHTKARSMSNSPSTPSPTPTDDSSRLDINAFIRAYQARGHLVADIDPLGIQNPEAAKLQGTSNLAPKIVVRDHLKGMTEGDLDREFTLSSLTVIGGEEKKLPLREIIKRLNKVYCGHLGLEYVYIHDSTVLEWLRDKFERPGAWDLKPEHRKWVWMNIMKAVTFESFLAKKFGTEKRFGLEGCESFIPSINECMESGSEHGVKTLVIGMAHRGRLNTLVNVCMKPLHKILTQFKPVPFEGFGSGDVKYHLGTYTEKSLERSGKQIQVSIIANPSHLEATDTVVVGRVKAEQVADDDAKLGNKSVCVLVHGDASFSGQGICYETMHLTKLPDYTTNGVIHIVINNQIGFTTDPRYSRSSAHCTDVARVVNAPIFHVHADDPDLVTYCSKVACEYRAEYHNDIVLDIVGYRRNGHNEMDEPMLTQPLMYKRIQAHPSVYKIYTEKLLKEGLIEENFVKQEEQKYLAYCESEFEKAKGISSMKMADWHDVPWTDFFDKQSPDKPIPPTGIPIEDIETICKHFSTAPKHIKVHNLVNRTMDRRSKLAAARTIDWAMAESLAFVTLLKAGHHVRLSGEDVERGTFSHRMHIVHDQERDKTWANMLNDVFPNQALYTVSNSPLSEYGVAGFELGYSMYNHNALVIWEGQFGDFANNCQVIMDNLISSGETKWGRQAGLVLLLPHGMEGQGPEHSSGRIERCLQLCDDDPNVDYDPAENPEAAATRHLFEINWIICNPTTPANVVHVFRRQILMPFRKPLVIFTPKSLLRHPMAISSFDEVGPDTRFQAMLPDPLTKPGPDVKKLVFCSGKVYYDIVKERENRNLQGQIAILRIEQLCPFPYHLVAQEVAKYPKTQIMWLQEEHRNQGAYYYVRDRLAKALNMPLDEITYGGRLPSASPATGGKVIYEAEYKGLLEDAMHLS